MSPKKSKKDKRLERKLEKVEKQKGKNARLSNAIEIKAKYIRISREPSLSKTPLAASPENYKLHYFSWSATHADTEGHWQWNEPRQWTGDEFETTIQPHLESRINNSWGEVEAETYNGADGFRKLLNKYQPLDSLEEEAQYRWLELDHLSQFEELFRLRLGSYKRIWGVRVQHHFFMVWYERKHKICPTSDN